MKIILNDLKNLCTIILTKAQFPWTGKVTRENNLYWDINLSNAYSFEESHSGTGVSSLIDDWEWLKKVLHQKNRSTPVDFDRLGSVITIMGYSSFNSIDNSNDAVFYLIDKVNVLELCLQLLSKAEDAGFNEIDLTIDIYQLIPIQESFDFTKEPTRIKQSLKNDWEQLKKFDIEVPLTAKIFESLGRVIKAIGETIYREEMAHTGAGLNFLFSLYDGSDEDDDDQDPEKTAPTS